MIYFKASLQPLSSESQASALREASSAVDGGRQEVLDSLKTCLSFTFILSDNRSDQDRTRSEGSVAAS